MEAHDQNSAVCPGCQSISHSRHSRYWRSLKDLPVQGTQVMLRLHLGRWRCRRRIFTERLPKVCAPYAQQTKRTSEIIAAVGHARGGRPGKRLMRRLGMPVSADTLIRQVKRAVYLPALPQVRVLGVDDWACRVDQPAGANRRHFEAGVPWLRWGQSDDPPSLDGSCSPRYSHTRGMGVFRISRFFWSRVAPRSRAEVLWTERTNFGEVFSQRSPDPVRDVRRREQQNDVLWARQEMSWLP